MSEEEMKIVETVENFIKYYKKNEQTGNRANLDVLREECNAIEFILNKYDIQQKELKQEKEKNKLTANDIENFKCQAYMLGRADENEAMKGVIQRHYISKDKIKECYKQAKEKIKKVEEDRNYGRYKEYGGKIKLNKYLARLYGINEICETLLEK
ncbi:MAG: hypothetical protein J6N78_04190 [Clostridia bacterium]|nr:hypothetical protein [Clostridia bacterium]